MQAPKSRSDFIYMTPPFIAYYGALYQPYVHQWLVYTSYDQIRLYRNYLFDSNVGLWKHIALGSFTDDGHWSTGNTKFLGTFYCGKALIGRYVNRQRLGCRWDATSISDHESNDTGLSTSIPSSSERLAKLGDGNCQQHLGISGERFVAGRSETGAQSFRFSFE